MPISEALKKSACSFCGKYVCSFSFNAFESRIEEFTFLRPNGGWVDVYKLMFEQVYKKSLEKVATGAINDLDGEAMLDDFEYTLIRPYVNESNYDINHKPYVGMDRIARLAFLDKLTSEAPSNYVDLYTEKYKKGELSIEQMGSLASGTFGFDQVKKEHYVEIAGCIIALENTNKSRSAIWRAFHPVKNNTEKKEAEKMKRLFIDGADEGEKCYNESVKAAYETFSGHRRVNANLTQSLMLAEKERDRERKMNNAMVESLRSGSAGV